MAGDFPRPRGLGTQASIGDVAKSINQKNQIGTMAPPPSKLGDHIDGISGEIEMLNIVLGRIRNICDALTGGRPREATSSNAAQPQAEQGLVGLAVMRRAQLRYLGEAIHAELDDIERVL